MRVAKDAVDTDILINNEDTSTPHVPCDAVFSKSLYKFSDSFALNSEYLSDFLIIIGKIFYWWIMGLWVNAARQMWRHLNVATFVEINVSGRGKASSWH